MLDYEIILYDRINVIKDVINKYGEDNFYIAFSGGKDSTVLHYLIDMAIPNNKIPRVFIDTGIEYNFIREFVKDLANKDERIIMIKPSLPIKKVLETYGYPFKSKEHSYKLSEFQKGHKPPSILKYINKNNFGCPKMLRYQFNDEYKLKISDNCCKYLKKLPSKIWAKNNNKSITITGMRKTEGGQRNHINCILTNKKGNLIKFHPLAIITDNWESEFIKRNNINLCKLYYSPYNFKRTGCKGCPFAINLQEELNIMKRLLPNEYKQSYIIWQPVYDEYKRIKYRLKGE